ncbi:hypothetical protein Tco_1387056 [Tanacetum coccineum]
MISTIEGGARVECFVRVEGYRGDGLWGWVRVSWEWYLRGGPSIEERAILFLEAQDRVKEGPFFLKVITWAQMIRFRPKTSRFEAWNEEIAVGIAKVANAPCEEVGLRKVMVLAGGIVNEVNMTREKEQGTGVGVDTAYPSLNTTYCLSWIQRIGLVSFVVFGECKHEYAISSLIDTAYWFSE